MSFLDDIKGALKSFPGTAPIGAGISTIEGAVNVGETAAKDASKVVQATGDVATSTVDFLNYISWIFHPLNFLRAAEFIAGIWLVGIGGYLIVTGKNARSTTGRVIARTIGATPIGREARMVQGARMGKREGQREAARMQARQRETLSAREASARERVEINRRARSN